MNPIASILSSLPTSLGSNPGQVLQRRGGDADEAY
jgi:hypothetical protein